MRASPPCGDRDGGTTVALPRVSASHRSPSFGGTVMNPTCQAWTALSGRILLSAIFLFSALGKIMDWSGTAHHMEQEGMAMVPVFLAGAIAFELLGGLSVLLGLLARYGVWLLIFFLIPTTLI